MLLSLAEEEVYIYELESNWYHRCCSIIFFFLHSLNKSFTLGKNTGMCRQEYMYYM